MKEVKGDIFDIKDVDGKPVVGVCFTSNGCVRKDGNAVMGAGVAKVFKENFPGIDGEYGKYLKLYKNNLTRDLGSWSYKGRSLRVFAFPTKNDWKHNSSLPLITLSAMGLKSIIEKNEKLQKGIVLLPRPGCSNGGLNWSDVKKVIESILPKNVVIVSL